MLKFIRTTRTNQGLSVTATLLKGHYPTAQKPPAVEIARLNLRRNHTLPAWNYTVKPVREM